MGEAARDFWWVIGIFLAVGLLWLLGGGPSRTNTTTTPFLQSPLQQSVPSNQPANQTVGQSPTISTGSNSTPGDAAHSPWYKQVMLSSGNAAYEFQPSQEYITIRSQAKSPVVITGWRLVNGRGNKLAIQNDSQLVAQNSFAAAIPNGVAVFDPAGQPRQGPIILNPGDDAQVVTGRGQTFGAYPITASFRVNKCAGYLEEENDYQLSPPLSRDCPRADQEVSAASLPDQCYDLVHYLAPCHIPKLTMDPYTDKPLVDGRVGVPKICVDTVLPALNYAACFNRHRNDQDFFGSEWRIFLNQRAEMWAASRESISLYDQNGLLVDQINY